MLIRPQSHHCGWMEGPRSIILLALRRGSNASSAALIVSSYFGILTSVQLSGCLEPQPLIRPHCPPQKTHFRIQSRRRKPRFIRGRRRGPDIQSLSQVMRCFISMNTLHVRPPTRASWTLAGTLCGGRRL